MRAGRLEQCDIPQRLYDHPGSLFVAGFIGSPAMNLVRSQCARRAALSATLGAAELRLPRTLVERCPRLREHVGREVILGIRPECIEDAAFAPTANGSCVDVDVSLAEPMGAELIAYFPMAVESVGRRGDAFELVSPETAATTLTARLNPRSSARAGGRIRLAVDVERLHFFDGETEQAIS